MFRRYNLMPTAYRALSLGITQNASEQILFMTIASTFRQIEQVSSRNKKQELFLALLNEISNKSRQESIR